MNKDEFEYCCKNSAQVNYTIEHNPKPIILVPELRRSIDRMLWYIPGISSVQSYNNYLIDDPIYSEEVLQWIAEYINIDRKKDIIIHKDFIPEDIVSKFSNKICLRCQKFIITMYKNKTILRSILRHIRNAIAHGNFNLVGDLALFIDSKAKKETAIIKTNILSLDEAIKRIENIDGLTLTNIYKNIFSKLGYNIIALRSSAFKYDLLIEKNENTFAVEIKSYKNNRPIGYQNQVIQQILRVKEHCKDNNIIPVLIFDRNLITEKAKKLLRDQRIILLDKENIKDLLNYNDLLKNID